MKCFPFQCVASGKRGVPRWEWLDAMLSEHRALPCASRRSRRGRPGRCRTARTGKVAAMLQGAGGTTLPGMRSATLPGMGGTTLPGTGLLSVTSRKATPQPLLPDCCIAKPACRIDKPTGLSSLSYCQISRIARSAGCQACFLPGLSETWSSRFSADIVTM